MNTLNDVLRNVDVAMVMMYAPWCLHSKMAAKHFIDVATKFGDIPNVSIGDRNIEILYKINKICH